MCAQSRDWESLGKIVSQIKKEGLTYVEGAKRFAISLQDIREYRRRFKDSSVPRSAGKVKNREELGDYVSRIRELGLSYIEGAERFGLNVKAIYKYNHLKRIKEKREKVFAPEGDVAEVGVKRISSSSSFYSWSREQTLFGKYLDDMKIEHIVADPHSPQTLGKVERLNQTVQQELLNKGYFSGYSYEEACHSISDYFHHYNYARPHQGIAGAFPASRFHGVIGETTRIESGLCEHGLDFSRGYLVFKMFEHTISIVCNSTGLQVFLDGNLLENRKDPGNRPW